MELFIIVGLILLFVFLNSLVYIAGSLATPPGMVFLGTVHWPGDYFYYLSQFTQGKENWFTSFNLYTNDFLGKTWVGWVNVFLGRLFSLLGINHLLSYQLSIVLFTVTFLGLSYLLIREIFPDRKRERIITFVLFASSNAFPKLINEAGKWSLSYYDFWFNIGIPFNRLGGVPHHLIARSVIVLSILLFVWFARRRKWMYLIGLLLSGFILGSIDPVQWGMVVAVLGITLFFGFVGIPLFQRVLHKIKNQISKIKMTNQNAKINKSFLPLTTYNLQLLLPLFFFFLGGIPIVIYLKNLFTLPPYSQLALWEATQQLHPGIVSFVLGNGLVVIFAIMGIFLFVQKRTIPRMIALTFTLLTIFFYFSPIPNMLGVVNVRFLPPVTTLFLACITAEVIVFLSKGLCYHVSKHGNMKFVKENTVKENAVIVSIVVVIFLLSLPAYFLQIQIRTTPDTKNGFFYITKDAFDTYAYAAKISKPEDTFLVMWPFNWSFPGITGRRVFAGHSLLTTDFAKKEKESFLFFDGKMTDEEVQDYLTKNKIDFIITYPWTPKIGTYPFLTKVREEGVLGIYRVK